MRVLPRLMPEDEASDFFPTVKLVEGEHQWASELEQGISRPAEGPGERWVLCQRCLRRVHLW